MTILQGVVLGLVQGLGEFLPISSTAHLAIVPWLFGWTDPGLSFDVALHLGTLAAVLAYFWRDWVRLTRAFLLTVFERKIGTDPERKLVIYILIALIPGAAAGLLLEEEASTIFRAPWLIAVAMIVMGIVLYAIDRWSTKRKGLSEISLVDSLIVGVSQAIAIVPGVSRSGITISAGLFRGLTREATARFSFLLSTPIIAGAGLLELRYILKEGLDLSFAVGVATAAVSGFLSIRYLLIYIQRQGYGIFVYYRFMFGAIVIAVWLIRYFRT
jgi:undecaprenyl-diphosphatase